MNKKRFDSIIFILFIGLIILISLAVFFISLKPVPVKVLTEVINNGFYALYNSILNQIILGLMAFLLFSLAIYLIQKKNRFNTLNLSVTQKTSFGEVKISLNSLKHLIFKVLKKMEKIKESKSSINILRTGGINIDLHLVLKEDVNIPEISEKIQRELKDYLLETTGIEVKEIKIYIDKVFYENREVQEKR
jgi:uncharacterized alkaline shock family protein YloU